jgi:membrane-associated phospholipid phosphatase
MGSRRRKLLLGAAALASLGGILMPFADLAVGRWCASAHLPGEVRKLINLAEVFGFGLSVAILLGIILVVDRSWRSGTTAADRGHQRRNFARFVVATYAGGLIVNLIKLCVVRVRPWATDFTALSSVLDTFTIACLATPPGTRADLAGFPSGHAATAAGFAAALSWRYPHAALLFAGLACVAAVQRLISLAHYPSDIAIGAAIGLAAAALVLPADS